MFVHDFTAVGLVGLAMEEERREEEARLEAERKQREAEKATAGSRLYLGRHHDVTIDCHRLWLGR